MTLHEVNEASGLIQEQAHEDAKVIWGLVFDDSMQDAMRITVIATGFEEAVKKPVDRVESIERTTLFSGEDVPPFIRNKVKIDYKESRSRSEIIDIDDERYDIPTFLRKQAD